MNATEWEALISVRDSLLRAGHGAKGEITRRAAAALGCSVATLYRKLEEAGLDTGRKRRSDAGETAMPDKALRLVSGLLFHSRRDNDKQLLTVEDSLAMLQASAAIDAPLSPGRVSRLLRDRGMHPDQLAQQRPATELRSLHPNHVWQIDSSTCVLYYMRNGALASMDHDEFYRNKPQNFARVASDLCTRYAVSDHTSGAFKLRYFLGGESAQNLVDFWLYAVSKQDTSPMHGVPLMVMLDPGAANKSGLFRNLMARMQVRLVINEVGNARAKGQVEKTHDLIERHFEGRFRFMPPGELTLENINTWGELFVNDFCATRKHSRHGQPRFSAWMGITADQLRVPAPVEVLRELVATEPVQRRVSNTMTLSYSIKGQGSRDYDVSRIPGVLVGGKLTVVLNAYRAPAIDVRVVDADTGEESWQTVEPIERNEHGFAVGAAVLGQEPRTARNTVADNARNRITQEAYRTGDGLPSVDEAKRARKQHAQAYAGVVDAMADVRATPVPTYMPRRGTALDTGAARTVVARQLSPVEICKRLKDELGDEYRPEFYGWVNARFADGAPEDQFDAIAAQLKRGDEAQPPLRAVGGGAA